MEWKKGWANKKFKNWGMLGKRGGCLGNCDFLQIMQRNAT